MKTLYDTRYYWSNEEVAKDYILDNKIADSEENITDDLINQAMESLSNWEYEDFALEIEMFERQLNKDYLVIADLGLWNGRKQGYRETNSLLDAVFSGNCDYYEVGVDTYNLVVTAIHHDGRNYYTIKEWKDGVTDEQKELLLDKLYCGNATKKDIARHTNSIRKTIANRYGW